ncbi:MAG: M23 family metallopeptidase [Burkholderiaceae bacterium]|nr:M23 family metallopeptidase [Microbacteriaceae bacterium]
MGKFTPGAKRRNAQQVPPVATLSIDVLAAIIHEAPVVAAEELSAEPIEAPARSRRELRERAARDARRGSLTSVARKPPAAQAAAIAATVSKPALAQPAAALAAKVAPAPARTPVQARSTLFGETAPSASLASETSAAQTKRRFFRPRAAPSLVVTRTESSKPARAVGFKRKMVSKFVTVSAMAGVGLMLVATTVPANAFNRPDASATSVVSTAAAKTQELTVEAVTAPALTKDGYTVVSLARQVQAQTGNRTYSYTNNPSGSIQWPFPNGSPIASGFGGRQVAGCGFCSTFHQGLDFTPGSGTPIGAIADGVVSDVSTAGAYGNHVLIDHVINGQKVQSLYAHMLYGSIAVAVGQTVTVGQLVGQVGSTGASTGAHLHLEVHLDGTPVDPYAWLKANAN